MATSKATIGPYWSRPIDDLIVALRSTPDGLSTAEATQRLQQFGPNVLKARKTATPLKLFSGQFKSPILVIILGSALLSFSQEYSAEVAKRIFYKRAQM
jgi:P-type Mg2+ transporter